MNGGKRNASRLCRKRNEPLKRPRHWGVDNIKVDFREIGWGGVDWFDLPQDRDCWRPLAKMLVLVTMIEIK
jgi:hypothetical protein